MDFWNCGKIEDEDKRYFLSTLSRRQLFLIAFLKSRAFLRLTHLSNFFKMGSEFGGIGKTYGFLNFVEKLKLWAKIFFEHGDPYFLLRF